MDKTYIDEQQVVERYLQGKLTGSELTTFEIYMLDHPEIIDDIEYAKGLQNALTNAKDELFADESSQPPGTGFWLGREYAVAATVLLAAAVAFSAYLYQQIGGLKEDITAFQNPVPITNEVWFEPVRGGRERVIESRKGTALLLRVDVSGTPAVSYTAELRGEKTGYHWAQSQINVDDEQSIRLLLSGLLPGRYRLSINADDSADDGTDDSVNPTAPVAEYRFFLRQSDQ